MIKIIKISMLIALLQLLVACIPVDETQDADTDSTSTDTTSDNDTTDDDSSSDTSSDDDTSDDTSANNPEFEESAEGSSEETTVSETRDQSADELEPPKGVYIESIDDVTRVTWETVSGADYYNVYAGQGEDAFIHVHSVTSVEEREYYLQEGDEYTGLFVTVVSDEKESTPSSIVFLSPQSTIYNEESVSF